MRSTSLIVTPMLIGVFGYGVITLSAFQRPGAAAAAPHGPDIRGLYLGMSADAARKQLQSLSDSARVESPVTGGAPTLTLAIPGDGGSDIIRVLLTGPPNPPVVWMIAYNQIFQTKPLARSSFMEALYTKYGKEAASAERGAGNNILWWLYDDNGQRIPSADARQMDTCSGAAETLGQKLVLTGPSPQTAGAPFGTCVSSYNGLTVVVTGPQFVGSYAATLVSLPLAARAGGASANAQNAAAEAARQKELEKAKQRKPVL